MTNIAAISLVCAVLALAACSKAPGELDRANCARLDATMGLAQVEQIMGPARSRREVPATPPMPPGLELSYHEQFGASGPVTVWLDDRGGGYRVAELWCDGGA
jgi:hypothetical protein